MTNPLLSVKNLNVYFRSYKQKVHAVRGISFDLFERETLGIVGESGCGKSASVKALLKLLPAHVTSFDGEAEYGGKNLLALSEKEMRMIRGKEIGMIFQDPMTSLNPTLKIGSQIIEGFLRHHPQAVKQEVKKHALELLHLVGISDPEQRFSEYPHTLSGGMRQRVMIALALASKPKLLIADEPTTSLDVTIQAQVLALLKEIQARTQTSILLITHDLSVVAASCDRVLVMYGGKIVESGTVEEVFHEPRHPYTQRLLQSIPRLDTSQDHPLIPIEGTPPDLSLPLKGCAFCPRCPSAMTICYSESPPLFQERSACWLYDPRKP
jgi:oligopeptide transport system ATP-binding protein